MADFRVQTAAEQVAAHLRAALHRGTWNDLLPGSGRLAKELGVGHGTIDSALELLESEGLLIARGVGRRRRIAVDIPEVSTPLRIRILPYQRSDEQLSYVVDLLHRLREAGHTASVAPRSLLDLQMDPAQVARHAAKTEADAWIVGSGSRAVLDWFSRQRAPTFALLGRRQGLALAGGGPDKLPALEGLLKRLIALGHRRIVLLAREERRTPQPGVFEQAFLDQLKRHGVPTSTYNLPDWGDRPGELQQRLDSLFGTTPPTALLIEEMPTFVATLQHLGSLGIIAPHHVSLVCDDPDPAFASCQPSISHFHWNPEPLVHRVVTWANNAARGQDDRHQVSITTRFVEGGTIGAAAVSY